MLDQDGSQHSGAQSVDVKLKGGNIDDWEVTEKTPVLRRCSALPGPDANRANKQKLGSQYGPLKERRPFQIEGLEESAFLG